MEQRKSNNIHFCLSMRWIRFSIGAKAVKSRFTEKGEQIPFADFIIPLYYILILMTYTKLFFDYFFITF